MRVNFSRGLVTALLGIGILSCMDGPTAPKPFGLRALTDGVPVPPIVISQVYGGGGNTGATLKNDFVELFNPGTMAVNVTGWSVQYMSSGGAGTVASPSGFVGLSGTIQPGGYYLVQEAAGANGTANLPTPDATGLAAIAATAGKVFLTSSSTVLSSACPTASVVDEVSFGSGTNCGSTTSAPTNTTAVIRKGAGCTYTGLSSADFLVGATTPRNTASATTTCGGGGAQPATVTVTPTATTAVIGSTQNFTATAFDNATPANVVSTSFTWSSDNTAVATVDAASGIATAKTLGTANISATSANGRVGSAALTVVAVPPGDVVISQIYGGGGNSGAQYTNDYVELFNRGTAPTPITGWTVQYSPAAGSSWSATTLSGTIAPGKYYLIKLATGGAVGDPLPAPDTTGSTNMAATAGKVLLAIPGANPTGACPTGGGIIDRVAFGSGTNCALPADWNGATPTLSNTTAAFRNTSGCAKTGNVSADFSVSAPSPRNSGVPSFGCPTPPGPLDHIVVTGGTSVSIGATVTLTAELQDAANQKITDAAATYTWQSADEATVHLVSTTANTATLKGMQLGGPITVTVTATSNGLTKTATPTLTVNSVATIVPSTTVVSEIHYDNAGTDVGEAFEIEGDAGTSLAGWSLVLYDGNGGAAYNTTALSGNFSATCGARGVIVVNFPNTASGTVQNAMGLSSTTADGWALVNALGQVTELKSYEGTFTATGGPAGGLTSTAIDADESTAPPAAPRRSIQRAGNGVWFGPALDTFGACNLAVAPASIGSVTLTSGKTELAFAMQTQFFYGGVDLSGHTVTSVVWSTSDAAIIAVDQKGIVTAKGLGSAKLIATAPDGAIGTIDMTIYLAAGSATARFGHNTEFGEPADANPDDEILIKRQQYTVSYSPARGGANWVSWNLDASHIGDNGRCPGTCYSADTALTKAGITAYTTADWVSGNTWDRGHMAPSADWTSSEADNNTTFFLSNFLPQKHELNAGPWEALENALRDSVSATGNREAYIIAGGIFTNGVGLGTILGLGKIAIPDSTWKIVVITPAGSGLNAGGTLPPNTTVMAVNMPNVTNPNSDWRTYLTTVAKIERSTGYNFLALLSASVQCQVEGNCAPTARLTSDISAAGNQAIVGQLVTFSGSTSSDPDEGDALRMTWSINGSNVGSAVTLGYRFGSVGTYQVRLTVTDNYGVTSVATTSVTVNPRPPANCGVGKFENAANFYACDPAPAGTYVAFISATSPTPCAIGSYQPASGQSSCIAAPAGRYVAVAGATESVPCAVGSYQAAAGSGSCNLASPGTYVAGVGADAAIPCAVGLYQSNTGATSCISSPAGSYVETVGAASATPCAPGSFQALTGQTSCNVSPAGSFVPLAGATEATLCATGSYQDQAGKAICILAPAGKFVTTIGATAASNCAAGSYQDAEGAASCKAAAAGSYVATEGAAAATPCALGSYQPTAGQTACLPAAPGQFVGVTGAAESTPCAAGTYQSLSGSALCKPALSGQYVATVGAEAATPCAPGMYQNETGATSCVASPAGSYVGAAGTAAATECPAGSFQAQTGQTLCNPAPIGSFVPVTGATEATPCAIGSYQDHTGAASCIVAPAGKFVATAGSSAPTNCVAGTYQDLVGTASCKSAPAGSYVSTSGATAAILCAAGTYQSGIGAVSCITAPPGSYVSTAGSATATLCAIGTYQNTAGSLACIPAPAGRYVPTGGATASTACSLGSYQSATGSASCVLAPIGSYVATVGAIAPKQCPVATTTMAAGATNVRDCKLMSSADLTRLAAGLLQQMVDHGQVSAADAAVINVSIDQALKSIEAGKLTAAKNQLGAAINKVEAAVKSRKIPPLRGAELIAALGLAILHM